MSTKQSVVFTDPQMKWLEQEAKRLGVTVSEVVRRIIDRNRGAQ